METINTNQKHRARKEGNGAEECLVPRKKKEKKHLFGNSLRLHDMRDVMISACAAMQKPT